MDITIPHRDADTGNAILRLVWNHPLTHCPSNSAENCVDINTKEVAKHRGYFSKNTRRSQRVKFQVSSENQLQLKQQATTVSLANLKENWSRLISSAQSFWWKLTEKELHSTHGLQLKLINLVRIRYAISRFEAKKQVTRFFQQTANQ